MQISSTSPSAKNLTTIMKQDDTKQIQENLNKWDDLCCLSEEQLSSISRLQQFNQYQIDDEFNNLNNSDLNLDLSLSSSSSNLGEASASKRNKRIAHKSESFNKTNDLNNLDSVRKPFFCLLYKSNVFKIILLNLD